MVRIIVPLLLVVFIALTFSIFSSPAQAQESLCTYDITSDTNNVITPVSSEGSLNSCTSMDATGNNGSNDGATFRGDRCRSQCRLGGNFGDWGCFCSTFEDAPDPDNYFEWDVSPDTGVACTYSSIEFQARRGAAGRCGELNLLVSTDGFNTSGTLLGNLFINDQDFNTIKTIDFPDQNFGNNTVTFRLAPERVRPPCNLTQVTLVRDIELKGECEFLEFMVELDPMTSVNEVLQQQTVTTVVTRDGVPQPGLLAEFEIISGPNAGEMSDPNTGECTPNDDCTTDSNGQVSWTYTGSRFDGTDRIQVTVFDPETEMFVDSNIVEVVWEPIKRNIPTLSEWGLIAMAGILGLVALFAIRRRKFAA